MKNLLEKHLNEVNRDSFQLSNQAIYWLNKDGEILYANRNALDVLGYSLDELTTKHVWDLDAIVDTKEKYLAAVENFKINGPDGQPNLLETFHKKKNGETFPVEVVSKFTEIGGEKYLISYTRDITSRLKRKEDVNFYFELIDSSRDMIFLVEHGTGKIEFVNETVCQTLGFTLAELRKKQITDIRKPFKELDNIEIPEVFKKIEELNDMTTFGIYTTKDGDEIPVETSLHKKNYHGKNFVVAISRNISERLEIEREKEDLNKKLKNYNKTLQKEIFKAKQELIDYENIMKRQSKMAAMGEMLENIAHQWRQPLSAVSVLSTGMVIQNEQDVLDKESLSKSLNDINEQVQYLSKTIEDFRNFFKPTKKKNHFNLESLINTSIKLSNARYSNHEIEFIVEANEKELYTYENELMQVLLNLISNAKDELIKKEHDKCILIKTYEENGYIVISIQDNAGGIANEILGRIFEPYFTTKHSYQGTGIGLYMSENIIKHMHGSIDVQNINSSYKDIEYKGACFRIRLPK